MLTTRVTLPDEIRADIAMALNLHLASAIDLHAQVKHAHWNVRGRQFIGLHELFDRIADEVEEWSELLAERSAALGFPAQGTIQMAAAQSYIPGYPLTIGTGIGHLSALASALATFAGRIRISIEDMSDKGDAVSADILTGIARLADQQTWKLEAHMEPAYD